MSQVRRTSSNRSRRRSGFTLLELILALGVTCMMALSLFASLRVGFKARDAAENAVNTIRGVQVALDLLGRDLKAALPPKGLGNNDGSPVEEFYGQPSGNVSEAGLDSSLLFYALCAQSPGDTSDDDPIHLDGVRRIEWGLLQQSDGTTALVRQVWRNVLPVIDSTDPDEQEIICSNVDSFHFEYSADGVYWDDFWDSTAEGDVMPVAVRAVLTLKNGDQPGSEFSRVYALPLATPPALATGGG